MRLAAGHLTDPAMALGLGVNQNPDPARFSETQELQRFAVLRKE